MPKRFTFPVLAIVVALLIYTAYWFYARGQIVEYVEAWEAEQRAAGFQIEHSELRIGGFPYRFSVTTDSLVVRAPESEGGWRLALDRFEANALPYDFEHWIVSLGDRLELSADGDGLAFAADQARFSFSGEGGVTQRIGASVEALAISGIGNTVPAVQSAAEMRLSAATSETGELAVQLQLDDVILDPGEIDPILARSFGDRIALLQAAFTVSQWPTLANSADLSIWSEASGEYTLRAFHIDWGRLDMEAEGQIALDAQLRPTGRISLSLLDPEAIVDAMIETGAISQENAGAMRLVAQSAPRSEDGTAIPLSFRNGGVYFGPVRLGDTGPILF
ncbi:DUF2125 domain-containing protein [Hyphobacterium sp.]|jgi:hypothetical protein|uniref:DUF2125 domain-containing protein n=1 Tax=Hyphobacterium sp. TaxID=2004662 RepID=UPI003BAAFDFB